jgi:hypothetical protein
VKKLEGKPTSQLRQVIKDIGFNQEMGMEIGVVTAAPPALKIKLLSHAIELDQDDLIVCQHLTKHTRSIKIDGGTVQTLEFQDELKVGDTVILLEITETQNYIVLDRMVTY